ncbi:MAG: bifunctional precorrin-2 dehydrogenase/sirohydrochlorin ferrochelatase [Magnetococcales bacterium]|nr:bifunctional precorrin-2 dehydrogenase/sirohydrochlorin ferrochelatase [Magnetococcales bacterium]
MHYYMAELNLTGRLVWVAGGGVVATRKIRGLLETGAQVMVMAPEFHADICQWQAEGRLQVCAGEFDERELDREVRPALVFAATGAAQRNRQIAAYCRERGIWCNSADDPEVSGFLVPAVVRRGALTVAVGTQGASPALSRLLKERIEHWLEPGWQGLVEVFGAMRAEVVRRLADVSERRHFWRNTALLAERERRYDHGDAKIWFMERLDAASGKKGPPPGD